MQYRDINAKFAFDVNQMENSEGHNLRKLYILLENSLGCVSDQPLQLAMQFPCAHEL